VTVPALLLHTPYRVPLLAKAVTISTQVQALPESWELSELFYTVFFKREKEREIACMRLDQSHFV